jgi:hypothetical protein
MISVFFYCKNVAVRYFSDKMSVSYDNLLNKDGKNYRSSILVKSSKL